jgi:hypothetical protein
LKRFNEEVAFVAALVVNEEKTPYHRTLGLSL